MAGKKTSINHNSCGLEDMALHLLVLFQFFHLHSLANVNNSLKGFSIATALPTKPHIFKYFLRVLQIRVVFLSRPNQYKIRA